MTRSQGTPGDAPTAITPGASVVFEHVTKRYDTGTTGPGAVNDLSMTIPAGCHLRVRGAVRLRQDDQPEDGQPAHRTDVRDASSSTGATSATEDPIELRRRIGYVIQQVGLFPHQSIGENVSVVPKLLGWDAKRRRARSDELLALVGLDPARYRDRYPSQLSGGERQRVGVARALAVDPPVMLMDEPFGAVDPIVRERLQDELLRLQEQLARTILFVTHDIDEAIRLGDVVAVFQDGGILAQFDTPDAILSAPASDFVARFVGTDRGLKRLSLSRVADAGAAGQR